MSRRVAVLAALLLSPSLAEAGPLDELPPGTWYRIPNSHLEEVAFDWSPESSPGNVRAIVLAWGGGAFDTREERLLLHGGGHGDYGGNEVYALDLDVVNDAPGTNPWARLSDPEARGALDEGCENPDNLTDNDQRRSQHTYGRLAYLPGRHALCDTGGSIGYTFCPALRQLDCFDLETNTWQLGLTTEAKAAGTGSAGAVHPVTGEWWLQGGAGSGFLGRLDPEALTWTYGHYDNVPGSSPQNTTMAIDPTRELLVVVGSGRMWSLTLSEFEEDVTELSELPQETTGPDAIVQAKAPGLAYDPVGDRMVGWDGGADVYLLDLDTWTWTVTTPGGDDPGETARNGTYGRFRYSPKYNVFVVVNATNDDAFVLKLSEAPPCTRGCQDMGTPDMGALDMGASDMTGNADMAEPADMGSQTPADMATSPDASGAMEPRAPSTPADSGCACSAQSPHAPAQGVFAVCALAWMVGRRRRRT